MHQVKLGSLAHSIALTPQLDLAKKKKGILDGVGGGEKISGFFFFDKRRLFTM